MGGEPARVAAERPAPILLDRERAVEKAVALIAEEAGQRGQARRLPGTLFHASMASTSSCSEVTPGRRSARAAPVYGRGCGHDDRCRRRGRSPDRAARKAARCRRRSRIRSAPRAHSHVPVCAPLLAGARGILDDRPALCKRPGCAGADAGLVVLPADRLEVQSLARAQPAAISR